MTTQENNTVTCGDFSIGDKVNTPYGIGFVWKVTESSVHVKHNSGSGKKDWLYSKYLANPKHHSQKPISAISHCIQQLYKWHFWLGDQSEFGKSIIDINTINNENC